MHPLKVAFLLIYGIILTYLPCTRNRLGVLSQHLDKGDPTSKSEDAIAIRQGEIVQREPTCVSRVKTSGKRHGGAVLIAKTTRTCAWFFIGGISLQTELVLLSTHAKPDRFQAQLGTVVTWDIRFCKYHLSIFFFFCNVQEHSAVRLGQSWLVSWPL